MSDPRISVVLTIQNEGGYTDNPADPGGATKYGVEQRDIPGTPIQTLTVEQATEYYLQAYVKPLYSQIEVQSLLNKLIDMGVLFGIGEAVQALQRVLGVTVDGDFGPGTLAATNAAGLLVLEPFKQAMIQRAEAVIALNPREEIFLKGWTRRIQS